jgi:cell division septum initiation protein DivIVA
MTSCLRAFPHPSPTSVVLSTAFRRSRLLRKRVSAWFSASPASSCQEVRFLPQEARVSAWFSAQFRVDFLRCVEAMGEALEVIGALASLAKALYDQAQLFMEVNAEAKLLHERLGDLSITLGGCHKKAKAGNAPAIQVAKDAVSVRRITELLADAQNFVDRVLRKGKMSKITKFLMASSKLDDIAKLNVRLDRSIQLLQTDMTKELGVKQDKMFSKLESFADRTSRQAKRSREREKREKHRRRAEVKTLRKAVQKQNALLSTLATEKQAPVEVDLQSVVSRQLRAELSNWKPVWLASEGDEMSIGTRSSDSNGVGESMYDSIGNSLQVPVGSLGSAGSSGSPSSVSHSIGGTLEDMQEDVELVSNGAVIPWADVKFPNSDDPDEKQQQADNDALIGRGAFAKVFRGQFGPETVAVKVIGKGKVLSNRHINSLFEEARVALTARHANVVMLFGVSLSPSHQQVAIVMELMPHSLWNVLHEDLSQSQRSNNPLGVRMGWLADVARALRYLHFRCIVHAE